MVSTVNSMDLIDQEEARRAQPRATGNRKPLFLFLAEGHKALIRPLHNLPECLVLSKHSKWAQDQAQRVNAICAAEVGKPCAICLRAAEDKKLRASNTFYLPVYVFAVRDGAGQVVTFKERDENGNETGTVPVKGIRVLELSLFGKTFDILSQLKAVAKDADYGYSILGCDFTVAQLGAMTEKTFTVTPKPLTPLREELARATPTAAAVRVRVLEALPPMVTAAGSGSNTGDPAIDTFVQGAQKGAVGVVAPKGGADEFPEF